MTSFSRGKIAEILSAVQRKKMVEAPEGSRITVHATVSRFAVLYEKMRNAIDYKDDHLLRKAAIVRILKRHLHLETDAALVATNLIRELIAARYLPNGVLAESMIGEAALVIKKFQVVKKTRIGSEKFYAWLLGIVAAELEELLDGHAQEKALVNFLFEQLGDRITLRDLSMEETERRWQIYVACHRSLSKADDEMMSYKLVRAYHTAWMQPGNWLEDPRDMTQEMIGVEVIVRGQLKHPLAQKFLHAVKPWAVALGMLRDALMEKPDHAEHLLNHPEELHATIGRMAERRYKDSKGKLRRGTVRAIIYLFITKILLALVIEVPFEQFLYKEINHISLAINVLFPPILMLFVGSMIRVPGKENVIRLKQAVDELLSVEGPPGKQIRQVKSRAGFGSFLLNIIYTAMFVITFGLIFIILKTSHFTWVSASIFIFFLCIVSFFAFRLRLAAREYVVVDRADRFRTAILDFFSFPILRAGQWLSSTISHLNIFIFFFDFIIETPFKIFLTILEEWLSFIKEKKEELQ
ncbi:MAG: hypothetical protein Q8R07_02815 [Candidatus Uhrbacteria bacterium]|nr:hypothetical protein [Candidatus Uhrbacteria bacterium]